MNSLQDFGRGCPSRRPPSPAAAQVWPLPGAAAAALPRRLHFEKPRRYLPAPPRTDVRLTQSRRAQAGGTAQAAAGPCPWQPLARVRRFGGPGRAVAVASERSPSGQRRLPPCVVPGIAPQCGESLCPTCGLGRLPSLALPCSPVLSPGMIELSWQAPFLVKREGT